MPPTRGSTATKQQKLSFAPTKRAVVEANSQNKKKTQPEKSQSPAIDRIESSSEEDEPELPPFAGGRHQSPPTEEPPKRRELDLSDKAGRYKKHLVLVNKKMGNLKPIHSKELSNIHHILRVFDLSYEYGPCIGVTRLERWERAQAMGLSPPEEVREILATRQGVEEDEFARDVFYGEV